jgi:hypothetical protein
MIRRLVWLLLFFVILQGCSRRPSSLPLSLCEISLDYGAYRDRPIALRGVYYYGLRQACPHKCADGPWPSFIELTGTEDSDWTAIAEAEHLAKVEAAQGKRVLVWVTAVGPLKANARRSPLGPCDRIGSGYYGFGHLGGYPAELVVSEFRDVEVKSNPASTYDYGHVYRGPA